MALQLVVLIAAGLVPVLSRGADWVGSWKMALDWGTFSLTLLGPAASGMACAAYVRLTTSGVDRIVLTGPRPSSTWLRPALAVWCLGAAATVLICLGVTAAATVAGARAYPMSYWVIAPTLCVLAAQVAVGVALGGIGRRRWLVPVAAATTFGLGILTAIGVISIVFRTGGSGDMAGETFDRATLVLQGGAALGLAAALVAVSNTEVLLVSRLARWSLPALAAAGLVAYLSLGSDSDDRYVATSDVSYVCQGEGPEVCLAEETTRPLDDLAARVDRQAHVLRQVGVRLPLRFVQLTPAQDADASEGVVSLLGEEALSASVTDETAARVLTTPRLCPQYIADVGPPPALFAARALLERWLLVRSHVEQLDDDVPPAAWLRLDLDQQAPWVRETYDQLRRCDINHVRLPRDRG